MVPEIQESSWARVIHEHNYIPFRQEVELTCDLLALMPLRLDCLATR